MNRFRGPDKAIVLVTHYQRILNYITPDFVHVLIGGRIVRSGGRELALELESRGYDWLREETVGDGRPRRRTSTPTMTQALATYDRYAADFEAFDARGRRSQPEWLRELRRHAFDALPGRSASRRRARATRPGSTRTSRRSRTDVRVRVGRRHGR